MKKSVTGQHHCWSAHKVNPKFLVLSKINHHNREKNQWQRRGVSAICFFQLCEAQKILSWHVKFLKPGQYLCVWGAKKQAEKTLHLHFENGQFKMTPEIPGFDKDPCYICISAVIKINLNFVSSNSSRGIFFKEYVIPANHRQCWKRTFVTFLWQTPLPKVKRKI